MASWRHLNVKKYFSFYKWIYYDTYSFFVSSFIAYQLFYKLFLKNFQKKKLSPEDELRSKIIENKKKKKKKNAKESVWFKFCMKQSKFHFTLMTFDKAMNLYLFISAMGKIVGQTRLSNLSGMETLNVNYK